MKPRESLLTRMGFTQAELHYGDATRNPNKHYLMKNEYSGAEASEMCSACADHYEWNKKFEYDVRTDTFYRKPIK